MYIKKSLTVKYEMLDLTQHGYVLSNPQKWFNLLREDCCHNGGSYNEGGRMGCTLLKQRESLRWLLAANCRMPSALYALQKTHSPHTSCKTYWHVFEVHLNISNNISNCLANQNSRRGSLSLSVSLCSSSSGEMVKIKPLQQQRQDWCCSSSWTLATEHGQLGNPRTKWTFP